MMQPFRDQLRAASKLQNHHRERLAIVYVRQSSPRQVKLKRCCLTRFTGRVPIRVQFAVGLQYGAGDRQDAVGAHDMLPAPVRIITSYADSMTRESELMQPDKNKAIIAAFVDAVNAQDWAKIAELIDADFARHSNAAGEPSVCNRNDLIQFLRSEYETFPDARESLQDLVAEANKVAARHRFQGTQRGRLGPYPSTGKVLTSEYIAIYRLEDGRIMEAWVEWDNLSGLKQLGHQPST